jgi:hypothetical protein
MPFHIRTKIMSGRKMPARRPFLMAALILGFMLSSTVCWASTFSWPTGGSNPTWAATGPTNGNTETVDYGYNAQGSLKVAVFNSGVTMTAGFPDATTSGNANVTGGTNTNSLQLATSTTSATTSYQQVTITFQYTNGASGVSFTLWDVDSDGSSFTDQISNISATSTTGTILHATVTGSSSNTVTGSGTAGATATGTSSNAQDSANGDVTISFTGQIRSLTFEWANVYSGTRGTQYIGVSPINFTSSGSAFPEVNSSMAALMLCGGLMGFGRFRRRFRTAESSHCPSRA